MSLDMVHDIQNVYRQLVDAMSRPGNVADITEVAGKLDQESGMAPVTQILAHLLLDTEVSFSVVSGREAQAAYLLSQLTYANETTLEDADFIFVLSDATSEQLSHVLSVAKIGELQDPHHSATVIIETLSLTGGPKLTFSGPGIQAVTQAEMQLSEDWIEIRGERNAEFPLGLDLIFTDNAHRLMAVPRTTQVVKEEIL